jgi:hypothetical protein
MENLQQAVYQWAIALGNWCMDMLDRWPLLEEAWVVPLEGP